jgi:hypothetical protein
MTRENEPSAISQRLRQPTRRVIRLLTISASLLLLAAGCIAPRQQAAPPAAIAAQYPPPVSGQSSAIAIADGSTVSNGPPTGPPAGATSTPQFAGAALPPSGFVPAAQLVGYVDGDRNPAAVASWISWCRWG